MHHDIRSFPRGGPTLGRAALRGRQDEVGPRGKAEGADREGGRADDREHLAVRVDAPCVLLQRLVWARVRTQTAPLVAPLEHGEPRDDAHGDRADADPSGDEADGAAIRARAHRRRRKARPGLDDELAPLALDRGSRVGASLVVGRHHDDHVATRIDGLREPDEDAAHLEVVEHDTRSGRRAGREEDGQVRDVRLELRDALERERASLVAGREQVDRLAHSQPRARKVALFLLAHGEVERRAGCGVELQALAEARASGRPLAPLERFAALPEQRLCRGRIACSGDSLPEKQYGEQPERRSSRHVPEGTLRADGRALRRASGAAS